MRSMIFWALAILLGLSPQLGSLGWPVSENWRKAARVSTVICFMAIIVLILILVWPSHTPVNGHTVLKYCYPFPIGVVVGFITHSVARRIKRSSRTPLEINYKSSCWVRALKELIVQISFEHREPINIKNIELITIGDIHIPLKELSIPIKTPFELPISMFGEQIYNASFAIPDDLQGKDYKVRLSVIADKKPYQTKSFKVRLK